MSHPDHEQADAFLTYLILGVILGGRLGYVLFYNLTIMLKIHLIFYASGMGACHFTAAF